MNAEQIASMAIREREALRAENERLRKSLQLIIKEAGPSAGLDDEPGVINTVSRIARAALSN